MTPPQKLLRAAAFASFAFAALHVGALFGGETAARFFTLIQQRSLWIVPIVLAIFGLLSVFGLYAWSGAGLMPRLPLLRTGLVTVGTIYSLRGLLILPITLFARQHPGRVSWQSFAFCIASLAAGLLYLTGTLRQWRRLGPPPAQPSVGHRKGRNEKSGGHLSETSARCAGRQSRTAQSRTCRRRSTITSASASSRPPIPTNDGTARPAKLLISTARSHVLLPQGSAGFPMWNLAQGRFRRINALIP